MDREVRCAAAAGLVIGIGLANPAVAQKQCGTLRVFHGDSPASMSILEEGSISAIMPMMGVFNNLVLFDQHVPQNRVEAIVPDLATSWNSNEEGTELTYSRIRNGDRVQSQLGVAPAEMTERTCGDLEMTPILKEGAP